MRATRSQSVYIGVSTAMSSLLAVGVAVTAGWFALRGEISIGELITVIGLAQFLLEPFNTMAEVPSWIAEARASADRVGWVEDCAGRVGARDRHASSSAPYALELVDVRHGSLDGTTLVGRRRRDGRRGRRPVRRRRRPRQGAVRAAGAADEYDGEVRVGGVELEDLDLDESHRALLVEPHRTDLFTGSLRSNLSRGDTVADGRDDWTPHCARRAPSTSSRCTATGSTTTSPNAAQASRVDSVSG